MNDRDRAEDRSATLAVPDDFPVPAQPVYLFDNEALFEVSNSTIFALIHLGLASDEHEGGQRVEMTIYTKSRGPMSRFYMALIRPFRHLIVYPALQRRLRHTWLGRKQAESALTAS